MRRKWLVQLRKASNAVTSNTESAINPLTAGATMETDEDHEDPESGLSAVFTAKKSEQAPKGKEGYLMKKSPNLLTGWQNRYFSLQAPGELIYWENVKIYSQLFI